MCGVATTCGSCASRQSHRRFFFEHVERGAADVSGFDRVGERLLVDQLAARGVDDAQALLALRARRALPKRCRVSAVAGMWRLT